MVDRFELFRLSLTARAELQRDLFADDALEPWPPPTREDFLRVVFGSPATFEHFGNPFVYVPKPSTGVAAPVMIGQIGRSFTVRENLPPDQGFADAEHVGWKAAVLVIDPRSHADGQKVSISYDEQVGEPSALIRRFVKYLNETLTRAPYHIEVEPIFSPNSFWEFAAEHRGQITSLRFEFVTPNMFGSSDSISEELKTFRDVERAQRVTVKIASEDGLDTDTPRVKESVEYTRKGAGHIIARAKGGKTYNSKKQTESVVITANDPTEPLVQRAEKRIGDILGLS